MKTKKIPAIIMLIAGSVACIITYLNNYSLKEMLITLIWVMIVFLILGIVVQLLFEKFEIGVQPEVEEEDGEVVEKTGDESEEDIGATGEEPQPASDGEVYESAAVAENE